MRAPEAVWAAMEAYGDIKFASGKDKVRFFAVALKIFHLGEAAGAELALEEFREAAPRQMVEWFRGGVRFAVEQMVNPQ